MESNFDELNGIAWDKGCYMGQELTARTKYRGLVKKRLLTVAADRPLPGPGTPILRDGREVGELRSGLGGRAMALRSEEHTSELQSLMRISYAVFCLKKTPTQH